LTVPTGNGEQRGPESAGQGGTNLPGTRPSRAAANNARNANFLRYPADPKDQGGFGTEDMESTFSYMDAESVRPSDAIAPPLDLMSMGDPGETFGGM
jgi:hypothetical protein